jgi:hypothetical protein
MELQLAVNINTCRRRRTLPAAGARARAVRYRQRGPAPYALRAGSTQGSRHAKRLSADPRLRERTSMHAALSVTEGRTGKARIASRASVHTASTRECALQEDYAVARKHGDAPESAAPYLSRRRRAAQSQRVALRGSSTHPCNERQNEGHVHRITRECTASNERAHLDAARCIDPALEDCQCSRKHGTARPRKRCAATSQAQAGRAGNAWRQHGRCGGAATRRHRLRYERRRLRASAREAESAMEAEYVRGRIGIPAL